MYSVFKVVDPQKLHWIHEEELLGDRMNLCSLDYIGPRTGCLHVFALLFTRFQRGYILILLGFSLVSLHWNSRLSGHAAIPANEKTRLFQHELQWRLQ